MSERWVCKRCFADNEELHSTCQRCGLLRGADATQADQSDWTAAQTGMQTAPQPGWRRWIRFWWIPALAVVLVIGYVASAKRGADGSLESAGSVSVEDLRAGDCFNGGEENEISDVDGVPCTQPHAYEVYAVATHDADTYPTDTQTLFTALCEPAFEEFVGIPWLESELGGSIITPSEESWADGDRGFICILNDPGDATLTSSMQGSNR